MCPKSNPPSIHAQAFDCPHCHVYTTQTWFDVFIHKREDNEPPVIPDKAARDRIKKDQKLPQDVKGRYLEWFDQMDTGLVFFNKRKSDYPDFSADNIHLSQCYHCQEISVWVHGNLLFPYQKTGDDPNPDLPTEIRQEFDEARAILRESPRAAAALLRGCIRGLSLPLGGKGIDSGQDAAGLEGKGLEGLAPRLREALDSLRVTGQNALPPGLIDPDDNRDTAVQLLVLLNTIADQIISHPRQVEAIYEQLPKSQKSSSKKKSG
ncbi:MAG: hypothetical protein JXA13_02820 [Anaerolineales bacterium]|nr:hypothetical protein [Anaerolineales bacterium]